MANPHKGEYKFEIDGKDYVLLFTSDAIIDLEGELGLSMFEIEAQASSPKLRMSLVRSLFLAGLVERQPDLDLQARRDLFKKVHPVDAIKYCAAAWRRAFGANDEAEGGEQNPPQPGAARSGTGPDSTPTGAG